MSIGFSSGSVNPVQLATLARKSVSGGGRTLLATDFGYCLDHTQATNWTLTLPTEAGAGFTITEGFWLVLLNRSTTNFQKVHGTNAGMLISPYSTTAVDDVYVNPPNSSLTLRYLQNGSDLWHVEGGHSFTP